jgi:hypothetical protein
VNVLIQFYDETKCQTLGCFPFIHFEDVETLQDYSSFSVHCTNRIPIKDKLQNRGSLATPLQVSNVTKELKKLF